MEERPLPGLEKFLKDHDEEKEKKEERIFFEDILRIFAYGEISCEFFKRMSQKKRDLMALKCAGEYDLQLPLSIKRRLRSWKGPESYEELKKAKGYKSPVEIEKIIHDRFPLSIKGFKKTVGPEFTSYTRKIGDKEIRLIIASDLIVPAGDLPKRIFRGIAMFSSQRKTLDPGPIEYKELLDRIGELPCSQSYMQRIRDLCLAIRYSGITVNRKDKNGELIHSDYAPFFKRFIWEGKLDLNARIFPILNEEFFKLLIDEELTPYIWIPIKRLKPDRKLTARDRLAQDQFRMLLGISFQRTKMRNWLRKFGEFTDAKITHLTLEELRNFVIKNFDQAKDSGFILDYQIKSFHKKSKYLDQIIYFNPAQAKLPKEKVKLTNEELEEIQEIANWLDEVSGEDYGRIEGDTILEYLMNAAEAGNLECIRTAYKETEDSGPESDYPVDEDSEYENRPMFFWRIYQSCRDAKK